MQLMAFGILRARVTIALNRKLKVLSFNPSNYAQLIRGPSTRWFIEYYHDINIIRFYLESGKAAVDPHFGAQ